MDLPAPASVRATYGAPRDSRPESRPRQSRPGFTMSLALLIFFPHDISETWISPSIPGSSSTNAPNSITRVTVPRTRSPALYFPATASQGCGCNCFMPIEMRRLPVVRDLEHPDFNFLSHGEHIRRLVDAAPGNFAHVQQGIHAAQIDESAIIGQAADGSAHGVTFLDLRVAAILCRRALPLRKSRGDRPPRLPRLHIELDDAAADFLPYQFLHLRGVMHAAARCRHKRAHAHIHAEAAFNHARDCAGDRRLLVKCLLQRRPVFRLLDACARESS